VSVKQFGCHACAIFISKVGKFWIAENNRPILCDPRTFGHLIQSPDGTEIAYMRTNDSGVWDI